MRYTPIDPQLFVTHRRNLAARMKPGSLAVFNANDVMPTNADGVFPFVQQSDLFYLCGIEQPETVLLLFPDAAQEKDREILFVKETSEQIAIWEGARLSHEEARALSGVGSVRRCGEFEQAFCDLAGQARYIYLNANEHPRAAAIVETRDMRFLKWCRRRFPLHHYERAAPIMQRLRMVKSAGEVALIREACRITEAALLRTLAFIAPGVWEFEIEAEIRHSFLLNRSRGPAYAPIVASGASACVLHYVENDRKCRAGDLVLMDFGAEYANYAADLTRTVPVDGRFTPRQRAVYDAVLRVQRAAMALLRPGTVLESYQKQVAELSEAELIGLGLLDAQAVRSQPEDAPLYRKYFMHGTSHHLGLDVHDVADRRRPLEAGMVLTCEPGIYIREEGIGVRLENDVLITGEGCVDLTAGVPIEAEEIEALMHRG